MTNISNLEIEQATALQNVFKQPLPLTNYLCHWSKRLGFLYVETPKVACTTIKRVLQESEAGQRLTYSTPGVVHDRKSSPLLSPRDDIPAFLKAVKGKDIFVFSFVRNPFSRSLSCYLDKMVDTESERFRLAPLLGLDPEQVPTYLQFLEAVAAQEELDRDIHWASQTYLIRPNRIKYSFIGRFEMFREQFWAVGKYLGIEEYFDNLPNTWHATNAAERIKKYMGPDEIALICKIYEDDFRNFGYGWSPELIA